MGWILRNPGFSVPPIGGQVPILFKSGKHLDNLEIQCLGLAVPSLSSALPPTTLPLWILILVFQERTQDADREFILKGHKIAKSNSINVYIQTCSANTNILPAGDVQLNSKLRRSFQTG